MAGLEPTHPSLQPSVPARAGLGATIGRYTLVGQLGMGAMGHVLAAHDPRLNRRVALKLLLPSQTDQGARIRLMREAQALAAVSHPNVVTVYEVDEADGQWFIAMELVDGGTLLTWQSTRSRSWRQIVDAYIQAAWGLAAAHRAGLIHRDFKPSNALITSEGTVRVSDFGLVRTSSAPDALSAPSPLTQQGDLTQAGATVGTPSYMSPEQHLGEALDARTDQFAFACALYEALYDQRPFLGETDAERIASCLSGTVRPEPSSSKVPTRIRTALRRALSRRREDRFESMEALIRVLAPQRLGRGKVALAAGVGILLVLGAVQTFRTPKCNNLDAAFRAAYPPALREQIKTGFASTHLPFANDVATRVTEALDAYGTAWGRARTQACQEALTGALPTPAYDSQVRCLDRALHAASGLVRNLVTADNVAVTRALVAVDHLPAVGDCADARLSDTTPLPSSPEARRDLVTQEQRLARAQALLDLGRSREAKALSAEVAVAAEATDHAPLIARAQQLLGKATYEVGDVEAGLQAFDRASRAAASAHDDALLSDILSNRFFVVGDRQGKLADALEMRGFVDLLMERAGRPPGVQSLWLNNQGVVLMEAGRFDESRSAHEAALALREKHHPKDHPAVIESMGGLANVLNLLGRRAEAEALLRRALSAKEKRFGAEHPLLVSTLDNLGAVLASAGKTDEALVLWKRSHALARAAYGEDAPQLWIPLYNSGVALLAAGRVKAAKGLLEEAMGQAARSHAPARHQGTVALGWGMALEYAGQISAAIQAYEAALTHSDPKDVISETHITALSRLAVLHIRASRIAQAHSLMKRALHASERAEAGERDNAQPTLLWAQAVMTQRARGCESAAPLFRSAREASRSFGPKSLVELEAWADLVKCLERAGKSKDAQQERDALQAHLTAIRADSRFMQESPRVDG
ncbi:MAG: protein kinase domain-containing protein [Myxococcaceae bacterium]